MRRASKETMPEQFAQRIAELTARVAELTRRIQSIEGYRGNGLRAQQSDPTVFYNDDEQNSIELITENGFVIVRPWEAKGLAAPADGRFRFLVQDPHGTEREIGAAISDSLAAEAVWRTRGRIDASSEFWICCAERRLANYLMEHAEFPPGNEMTIETLDREDVLLAIRWGKVR